jgi:predicted TIM-barrel fold metal-dependent hydrolase
VTVAAQTTGPTTYAAGRRIIDVDAHIMEPTGWLASYAPAAVREVLPDEHLGDHDLADLLDAAQRALLHRSTDQAERERATADYMTMERKGWMSLGGWDRAERTVALDRLGFDLQVVFPTASFPQVLACPADQQVEAIRAMNRGLADFCTDPRLSATGYVPFHLGPEVAVAMVHELAEQGVGAFLVDSVPRRGELAFSHPDFYPVWAAMVEADRPAVLHVGADGGYRPVPRAVLNNGREMGHVRSDAPGDALSFTAIGYPAELFLGSLVFDGVFERFPRLRVGITELGVSWLPSFLHMIDTAHRSLRRIQNLSHLTVRPSEYVRRQVVVSPFAGEDVGWVIEQSDPACVAFSSDYPHHEGTDDPIRRFEASMTQTAAAHKDLFYAGNGRRLLGV